MNVVIVIKGGNPSLTVEASEPELTSVGFPWLHSTNLIVKNTSNEAKTVKGIVSVSESGLIIASFPTGDVIQVPGPGQANMVIQFEAQVPLVEGTEVAVNVELIEQ